jgi:glucosamine--fructose-6-phosphate aminotransferase (isomerizing)
MIGNDSLVIGLLSGNHMGHQLGVLRDVRAMGAAILAVAEKDTSEISEVADFVIALNSGLPPVWRAPLYLPVLQLTAYYRAIAKGLDPDHPTHLQAVVRLDE